jgi:hypothetical protein
MAPFSGEEARQEIGALADIASSTIDSSRSVLCPAGNCRLVGWWPMDSAIAGLLGAGIGALAGLTGAVVTNRLQSRVDQHKWLRDRRVEAYTSAIRFLIRVSNKRSQITAAGTTVLGQDAIKEWFDDLNEARSWLTSLLVYCSDREREKLTSAIAALNAAAAQMLSSGLAASKLVDAAQAACVVVADSARSDIGSDMVKT